MSIKPSLCLDSVRRSPIPTPSANWPAHTQYIVRSQGEFDTALNTAWRANEYAVIILTEGLTIVAPKLQGQPRAKEIIIYGGGGEQTERIIGTGGQIIGMFGTARIGWSNLALDGQEGISQKGVVIGSANGDDDGRHAPVIDCWFSHCDIFGMEQQMFMVGDDSARIMLIDVDLHDNGHRSNGRDHYEGWYTGKGGNRRTNPRNITGRRIGIYNVNGGEAIDLKVDTTDVLIEWADIQHCKQKYSGAVTIGIDNHDGGHGNPNNITLRNFYINDVSSLEHGVAGVQAGTGATLSNFWIDNIHDGPGIQTLKQAAGPDRTLRLENGYLGNVARGPFSENGSTGQGNDANRMTIEGKETVHTRLGIGGPEAMRRQIFGGAVTPPPTPTPAPTPAPSPTPAPTPAPTPSPTPSPTLPPEEIVVPVPVKVTYDLTSIDAAIAGLQTTRDALAELNEQNG